MHSITDHEACDAVTNSSSGNKLLLSYPISHIPHIAAIISLLVLGTRYIRNDLTQHSLVKVTSKPK